MTIIVDFHIVLLFYVKAYVPMILCGKKVNDSLIA